jgi:hypothetical protein
VVDYEILPIRIATSAALAIIVMEVLLAVAFVSGWLTELALALAAGLLLVFMIAVAINLRRERLISCGCFGSSSETISLRTLARLTLLLTAILLLAIALRISGDTAVPKLASMSVDGATLTYMLQAVSFACFLVLVGAWVLSFPELASLRRQLPKPAPNGLANSPEAEDA